MLSQLTRFEVEGLGNTPNREQAQAAGRNRAAATGKDVKVVGYAEDGQTREVLYHPDGTIDRLWEVR